MWNALLVTITALCSGIIATLVTIWWQMKHQKKIDKNRIFTILMSKRYEIVAEESVEALNMIDVVFYKSEKVRKAWKDFYNSTLAPESKNNGQIINDKYLRLLEIIAEDIGYKKICWEDIKQYYYPTALSEVKQNEAILKRLQIEANIAQINNTKNEEKNSQTNKNNEFANQVLIEAIRNPAAISKLIELADKTSKPKKN